MQKKRWRVAGVENVGNEGGRSKVAKHQGKARQSNTDLTHIVSAPGSTRRDVVIRCHRTCAVLWCVLVLCCCSVLARSAHTGHYQLISNYFQPQKAVFRTMELSHYGIIWWTYETVRLAFSTFRAANSINDNRIILRLEKNFIEPSKQFKYRQAHLVSQNPIFKSCFCPSSRPDFMQYTY